MSTNIFDLENKESAFNHPDICNKTFISMNIEKYPTNLFEFKNKYGSTVFHLYKYDETSILEYLEKYPTNLFELKNNYGYTIFHYQKYSEGFILKHLEKHPTNLFELKSKYGSTIFHLEKYSEELLSGHLEKYQTNLFELKNGEGCSIFHCHKYSKEFVKMCADFARSKFKINEKCIICLCNFNGFVVGSNNPFVDESMSIETPGEEQEVDVVGSNIVTTLKCGHIVHPNCYNKNINCRL